MMRSPVRVQFLSGIALCAAMVCSIASCHPDSKDTVKIEPAPAPPVVHSITGDVRYHENFHSKNLNNDRTIIVWLPPGYEADKFSRYPVLYMHDGQNLFDDQTTTGIGEWRADETATRLIEQKIIEPIIIVGIANAGANRTNEYTPTQKPVKESDANTISQAFSLETVPMEGGNGELYARFLIDEVKPFIDRAYRTLPDRRHTAVAGSSLGGLMSLYLGWKHGDVFSKCGCLSPSLWWNKEKLLHALETDNAWMQREQFWLDMGTDEGSVLNAQLNINYARTLRSIMLEAGLLEGRDFEYEEVEGGRHNEQAWSKRLDQVLIFFFEK